MSDSDKKQTRGRNLGTVYCPGEHIHIEEEIVDFADKNKGHSYSSIMTQCIVEGWKVFKKKQKSSKSK